jgi:hypothetical protein
VSSLQARGAGPSLRPPLRRFGSGGPVREKVHKSPEQQAQLSSSLWLPTAFSIGILTRADNIASIGALSACS